MRLSKIQRIGIFLILLFPIGTGSVGCSRFGLRNNESNYNYYPIPSIYLQPCNLPEEEPKTIGDLIYQKELYRYCSIQSNRHKEQIKELSD